MPTKTRLDAKDRTILKALKSNARMRNADLARLVGMSEGAIRGRLSWLEHCGAILGYTALIRPGLVDRAPLCWATFSLAAFDPIARARFEQGLRAAACVDHLDRLATSASYVIRAAHDDIADLINSVALSAGVMVHDIHAMRVEAPVGVTALRSDHQRRSLASSRSGTADQSGYETRRDPN